MIYVKNFDSWNDTKKKLDARSEPILFQEREIWMAHVGINIGIEQNGNPETFVRPVMIFQKFSKHHFIALPLTKKPKPEDLSYILDEVPFLKWKSWLLIHQIRVMDSKRLHRKLGKVSSAVFGNIIKKSARVFSRASGA